MPTTSESRFRALSTCSPVGIFMNDVDGLCVYANQRCLDLCGFASEEDALGIGWANCLHPDDRDDIAVEWMNLAATRGDTMQQFRIMRRPGVVRWMKALTSPIFSDVGEYLGRVGTIEDITERKLLEDELRLSEERLRLVADATLDAYYDWNVRTNTVWRNRGYHLLFGSPEGVVEDSDWWLDHIHPDDRDGVTSSIRAAFEQRQQFWQHEYRFRRRSGAYADVHDRGLINFDEGGRPVRFLGAITDITLRKQAEQTASLLAAVVSSSQDAIYSTDLKGVVQTWNPAAERLYGYSATDMIGNSLACIFPPGHEQDHAAILDRFQEGVRVQDQEVVRRRKDGSLLTVSLTVSAILDAAGRLVGTSRIAHDITERKGMEAELRSQHNLLVAVTENTHDAIFVKDRAGRYLMLNAPGARSVARRVEEFLGHTDHEVFGPETGQRLRDVDTAVMDSGEIRTLEEVIVQPGRTQIFDSIKAPYRDAQGNVIGLIGITRDVTERKQAEERLRQSEERFARFMQHLPGLAWIKDAQGRYLYVNGAAEKQFGSLLSALRGKTDAEVFDAVTAAQFVENDRRALASHDGIQLIETLKDRAGVERSSLVSKFPIQPAAGQDVLIGGIAIDITEQKRIEEALRRAHDELDNKVRERTQQLEDSLHEKEIMLKEIHHRVKNNLQIVTSLLSMQAGYAVDPHMKEVLHESEGRVRSMALVHEQLYRTHDMARVDFADYARTLTDHLLRSQGAAAQRLALQLDIRAISLGVDLAIPCGLILTELLSNALKHAFPNQRAGAIWVRMVYADTEYSLCVEDNGVGIPNCLDVTTTNTLGLRLVRALVEQLEGTWEVTTNTTGTRVALRFPSSFTLEGQR